jgi:hypothetical protein
MALINFEAVNLEEISAANSLQSLTLSEQNLGTSLYHAFNDKSNPERLKNLVLNLGMEKLAENAKLIFKNTYPGYVNYLKFSKEYYETLMTLPFKNMWL